MAIEMHHVENVKDVRGWQFLTIQAAEICVWFEYHQRNIFSEKKYLGDGPFKKSHFIRV